MAHCAPCRYNMIRGRKDASQKALEQVEKATDSQRAKGEDLLGSEDLKRQLRDAKQRLAEKSSDDSR
jgi:hypothetical protein